MPFLKVLAAFAAMLAAMRLRAPLSLAILSGGVLMGIFFNVGAQSMAAACLRALTEEKFLFLAAIVGLILVLSDALERSGQSRRLLDALSGYLTRPRLRLVFFPALIGLLPMPGGAVFSAPLTEAASKDMEMDATQRALINYWFRHVWELAWPLYPGIILTVALADIQVSALISRTWPAVLAMFGAGWIFFLRPGVLRTPKCAAAENLYRSPARVLKEGMPLIVAIVGAIGLEALMPAVLPGVPFEAGVLAALAASVGWVTVQNRIGRDFLLQVVSKKSLYSMLLVIAAIFIFKEIMHSADVVQEMADAAGDEAALFAAAVFLPFLVGMVSGINVAFVGATFPLLLGLLAALGISEHKIPYLVLASFAGFTGVMISPLHICFILSCQFFGVNIVRVWRRLVPPSLVFAGCGLALFLFLLMTGL
ncbi:MAG: DUF401 family protein [Desulfonatronovibrionaceae bacterium]